MYWHKSYILALNAHLVALTAGKGGGSGPHLALAHLNSPLYQQESLSAGNVVPHHHHECTNWGYLVG